MHNKIKKTMSSILVLLMVFSLLAPMSVAAYAKDDCAHHDCDCIEHEGIIAFRASAIMADDERTVHVSSETGGLGETVTLTVSFLNNPGVAGYGINLKLDTSKLEFVTASAGDFLKDKFRYYSFLDMIVFESYNDLGAFETGLVVFKVTIRIKSSVCESVLGGSAISFLYYDPIFDGFDVPTPPESPFNSEVIFPEIIQPLIAVEADEYPHTPGAAADCTNDQVCAICGEVLKEALGHDYAWEVTKDPTCIEFGEKTYTCKRAGCGDAYTEPIPMIPHDFTVELVRVPATCRDGYVILKCSRCEAQHTEILEATGEHAWDSGVVTPPTCTAQGYTTYTCTVCAETDVRDHTPKIPHTEATETEPATCTEEGYIRVFCSVCETEISNTPIPKIPHDFTVELVRVPATCKDGYVILKCSRCEAQHTEILEATGEHVWDVGVVTPPTCTAQGYTTYTCTVCAETDERDHTPKIPHTEATETEPATCTEEGYIRVYCSVCGTEISNTPIPKIPHTEETETEPATCTEEGYFRVFCSVCETEISNTPIPKIPHDFTVELERVPATCIDGYVILKCSRCEAQHTKILEATGEHAWDSGVVTTPATCALEGVRTFTCTRAGCGVTYTEAIPKNPNNHTGGTVERVITPATLTADGLMGIYCSGCNVLLSTRVIPKPNDPTIVSDAEFLQARAAGILKNGLTTAQLHLSANNNATLTLLIDGRIFILAVNVNNRNVSGQILLPDGSGTLKFDIKGNGSNVKMFEVTKK